MAVFRRMDKNGDGHLDVDEMHEVATMLGEDIPKSEVKEMIKMFPSGEVQRLGEVTS